MDSLSPSSPRRNTTTCSDPFDNFYVCLLSAICLLGLIVLCVWLALIPKNPTTTITDVSVPTSNGSSISYTVEFDNPNSDSGIYYDDILLVFLLGDDSVGDSRIGTFYQGKKKTYAVKGNVDANSGMMTRIREKISVAKTELKLSLRTRIRFKTWGRKSKYHGLDLQGLIPIGSNGKISSKKKKVKLHHSPTSKKFKFKGKYIH